MIKGVFIFIIRNWFSILSLLLASAGFLVYFISNIKNKREKVTIIVIQIQELSNKLTNFNSTFIQNDNLLNPVSLYNSETLIKNNYWEKYKHMFVLDIGYKNYESINRFYEYIEGLNAQVELFKRIEL